MIVSVVVRPRQVREEDGIKRAQLAKILDVPQAELDRKLDDVSKNDVPSCAPVPDQSSISGMSGKSTASANTSLN